MARKAPGGNRIGIRVRDARARLGWTRETLAFHSGLSWSAVTQVESGRRTNLRPDTLSALATALGVTIDYLVHGGDPRPAMFQHRALFYGEDEEWADTVTPFVAEGIERSEPVLVATTPSKVSLLRKRLGPSAKRIELRQTTGSFSKPDAALHAAMTFTTESLSEGASWVRIVGEPLWAGTSAAERRLWHRYEALVNLVFAPLPVTSICSYNEPAVGAGIVRDACSTHPETIRQGEVASNPDYVDPGAFVLGS